jgi:superfamily II DNA/RNA helicase
VGTHTDSDLHLSSFSDVGVPARLTGILSGLGIDTPTPIQSATLPDALAGRDVLGRGRTGSGKTYAFLLPLVARLSDDRAARPKAPRALILAPTRELANQIDQALAPLAQAAGLTSRTIFGGVGQNPQVAALRRGVDIIVACPGRLEDLIAQGHCTLDAVEITVVDEADHMADLGFLPAVRRLLTQTPRGGQRLLFSATLDRAVDTLVRQFLVDPVTHEADSAQSPVSAMSHHVLHVDREHRLPILVDLISAPGRTVVFTRTKRGAKTLARQFNSSGVPAVELHGNLAQNARTRNLEAFHDGRASALVATDIAARGIHVDDVTLVIHADPPAEHKAYLHRSGRTARAGNAGTVVTIMTSEQVRDVRQLTRAAGIAPTTTRIQGATHAVLNELAPGDRVLSGPLTDTTPEASASQPKNAGTARRRNRRASQKRGSGSRNPASTGTGSASASEQKGASRHTRRRTPGQSNPPGRLSAAAFSADRR